MKYPRVVSHHHEVIDFLVGRDTPENLNLEIRYVKAMCERKERGQQCVKKARRQEGAVHPEVEKHPLIKALRVRLDLPFCFELFITNVRETNNNGAHLTLASRKTLFPPTRKSPTTAVIVAFID